ncbi:nitrite reductase small subunit NirD [Nitriliruptoraceae bacterium ZYF776]|nr:nitrite reductase small subunit NirD [Profundirhabdus halotolerans]
MTPSLAATRTWTAVCPLAAIVPDTGVAALVDGGQVAVFRLADGAVHALGNHDPCSGANVLSRGILGDVDGEPVVASPVHKQRFSLTTGRCLDAEVTVPVHPVRVVDGVVEVRLGTP